MNPIEARARIEARLGRGVCGAGLAMGLCLGVAEAAPATAPADVSAMDASTPTQDQGVDDLGEAVALYEAPMTCQAALSGADNDTAAQLAAILLGGALLAQRRGTKSVTTSK